MKKLKLLIADASEEFCLALTDRLKNNYVIRLCAEGNETLDLMRSFQPDVMILDLTMPGLDGITLLQRAAKAGCHPVILATTRFISDYVQRCLSLLGVSYIMIKPCEIDATIERLADMTGGTDSSRVAPPDPRVLVTNMLLSLGFDPKLKGFACLVEAVVAKMQDSGRQITKEIYPKVVEVYGGNGRQVERAIRLAIQKAWVTRDEQLWRICFHPEVKEEPACPSNGAFIAGISTRIMLNEESRT